MNDQTLSTILAFCTPIIVLIVSIVGNVVTKYISGIKITTKSTIVNDVLNLVKTHAVTIVESLNQTLVDEMKSAAADGKLTPEECQDIMDTAVNSVKALIPAELWDCVSDLIGEGALEGYISDAVESAVRGSKTIKSSVGDSILISSMFSDDDDDDTDGEPDRNEDASDSSDKNGNDN